MRHFILTCFYFALTATAFAQVPTNGLQLWLKADAITGLADGDSVSTWLDLSSGNRNATSTGSQRPVYKAAQKNGLPALRFKGTTGFSTAGSAMTAPAATGNAVTAFVVAANRRASLVQEAVDVVLASKTSGDPNTLTGFGFSTYNGFAGTASRRYIAEAAGNGSSTLIRKNSSSGAVTMAQNEYSIGTYVGKGIVNGAGSGSSVRIGSFTGEQNGLYGENDVAEILLYTRAMDSAELLAIESYLSTKYAIPVLGEALGTKLYRGGELRTLATYTYGRFETRWKPAAGSGIVGSLFTYHIPSGDASQNWNEIDIEVLGRYLNIVTYNTITPGIISHFYKDTLSFIPYNDYHTYAFEWTPAYVAWFVDGVERHRQTASHIQTLTRAQNIFMNLWQPGYVPTDPFQGDFNPDVLPVYSFYDYVKYASYTPGGGNTGTGNNFTQQWTDDFDSLNTARWLKGQNTSFDQNNVDFIPENTVFQDGKMILCLTKKNAIGYPFTSNASPADPSTGARPAGTFSLSQNYPNPFNPETAIGYQLAAVSDVSLKVFDVLGREVATLVSGRQAAGNYSVRFNAARLSSGVYFYKLQTGNAVETKKMVLMK